MELEAGAVAFSGLALAADRGRVMTPRPRSEELVRRAAARAPRGGVVADVGTGSGAIAVAIAAARPDLTVWAIDTSSRAVLLARRNAALHGVAHRVAVREGDLLAPVTDRVDVVVANLPYLAEDERPFRPDLACDDSALDNGGAGARSR